MAQKLPLEQELYHFCYQQATTMNQSSLPVQHSSEGHVTHYKVTEYISYHPITGMPKKSVLIDMNINEIKEEEQSFTMQQPSLLGDSDEDSEDEVLQTEEEQHTSQFSAAVERTEPLFDDVSGADPTNHPGASLSMARIPYRYDPLYYHPRRLHHHSDSDDDSPMANPVENHYFDDRTIPSAYSINVTPMSSLSSLDTGNSLRAYDANPANHRWGTYNDFGCVPNYVSVRYSDDDDYSLVSRMTHPDMRITQPVMRMPQPSNEYLLAMD